MTILNSEIKNVSMLSPAPLWTARLVHVMCCVFLAVSWILILFVMNFQNGLVKFISDRYDLFYFQNKIDN